MNAHESADEAPQGVDIQPTLKIAKELLDTIPVNQELVYPLRDGGTMGLTVGQGGPFGKILNIFIGFQRPSKRVCVHFREHNGKIEGYYYPHIVPGSYLEESSSIELSKLASQVAFQNVKTDDGKVVMNQPAATFDYIITRVADAHTRFHTQEKAISAPIALNDQIREKALDGTLTPEIIAEIHRILGGNL